MNLLGFNYPGGGGEQIFMHSWHPFEGAVSRQGNDADSETNTRFLDGICEKQTTTSSNCNFTRSLLDLGISRPRRQSKNRPMIEFCTELIFYIIINNYNIYMYVTIYSIYIYIHILCTIYYIYSILFYIHLYLVYLFVYLIVSGTL